VRKVIELIPAGERQPVEHGIEEPLANQASKSVLVPDAFQLGVARPPGAVAGRLLERPPLTVPAEQDPELVNRPMPKVDPLIRES